MNRLAHIVCLIAVISLLVLPAVAQETTPEVTAEVTNPPPSEATSEATATVEPTAEGTAEATTEATLEPTVEPTSEATAETTEPAPVATVPPGALLDFPGPGGYTVQVTQAGIDRAYGVYIPEAYADAEESVPLVIVMHGASGNGLITEQHTGFSALADEHGFIVAYPDGVNGFWNDGRPVDPRINPDISDSIYIAGMINFLKTKLSIDLTRVYLTGYSMGGMMSIRGGCELSDQIAAFASVASTMPEYANVFCENSPPIPAMFLIGTDDQSIPWGGVPRQGSGYLSALNTVAYWAAHNSCNEAAQSFLPNTDTEDGTLVTVTHYTDCANDADVILYGIVFGGHTWPGHPNPLGIDPGLVTNDIDGTQVIWDFFSQHALPAAAE